MDKSEDLRRKSEFLTDERKIEAVITDHKTHTFKREIPTGN